MYTGWVKSGSLRVSGTDLCIRRARRRRAGRRVAGFVIIVHWCRRASLDATPVRRALGQLFSTVKSIQRSDFPTRRAAAGRAAPATRALGPFFSEVWPTRRHRTRKRQFYCTVVPNASHLTRSGSAYGHSEEPDEELAVEELGDEHISRPDLQRSTSKLNTMRAVTRSLLWRHVGGS